MTRHALCIGINDYPGTRMDLAGCVNDAGDWAAELASRGFQVKTLLNQQATKAAMVDAIRETIGAAAVNELVVITYSGHGTYVPDLNGDELDGLDEGLCPHDLTTAGALLDDEIHALFAQRKSGVRLVLVSDSCHSGTVTRAAVPDDDEDDAALPRPRFMPMGNWLPPDRLPKNASGQPVASVPVTTGESPLSKAMSRRGGDLLLAGCKEGPNNFSYDARIKGRPCGAFSYYALKTLKTLPPGATYGHWHQAITPDCLPTASYPQTPQLVGSSTMRSRKIFE